MCWFVLIVFVCVIFCKKIESRDVCVRDVRVVFVFALCYVQGLEGFYWQLSPGQCVHRNGT